MSQRPEASTELGPPPAPPPLAAEPTYRAAPPIPAESRRRGSGCCIAITVPFGLVLLLVVGVGAMLIAAPEELAELLATPIAAIRLEANGTPAARTPPSDASPASGGLTAEQQRLVDRLSHPDTFVVVIGADDEAGQGPATRLELWNYHVLGTCFTFEDGVFHGLDESMEIGVPMDYPSLRPEQFHAGMSVEDVNRVVGDIPYVGAEVVPEIAPGTDIYVYNQGLVVAFVDGSLVYASTEWGLPTDLP